MDREVRSLFEMLEQKNSYLLEFHKINTEEMDRLAEGCADHLEDFYYSRELLLNAIDKLDRRIQEKERKPAPLVGVSEKNKLKKLLSLKKNMILSILDQDLTILSLVEKINKDRNLDKDIKLKKSA
ncbi:MAG: hypothetical protein OXB86_06505 [Bdellovibrionales bacterium]|nr:hypothetical protein [Bdellovibrionales bacterium]